MPLTRVVVGRLGRPHGIRGEVTVELRTDSPELRFAPGARLFVQDNSRKPLTVEAGRVHSGVLLVKFVGQDTRNAAEALRGLIVESEIDESELPEDEDEYYDRQLLGLTAMHGDVEVGEVVDVLHLPSQDVLVIKSESGREILVPFIEEFVPEIDLDESIIVLTPPPGLLDDNFEVAGDAPDAH